ncbi:MAG: APC family permease [Parvibaculum sp.]
MSDQTASSMPVKSSKGFKRVLKSLDMTLFTVCAILVIDQLAASASIGAQSIFWWIFTLVFFFIPYGLITAELGSTYPDQGGIYSWVQRAFGGRWGGRTAWLWWINVALWQPSVYIIFTGIFAQLFMPDLGLWPQIGIAIVLTWITTYINIIALDAGKWVPNIGAVFKAVIMAALGFGGIWYAMNHGVANPINLETMTPSWGAPLAFLPVIVYNFMGFELMSGAGEEMENPARDVPKAIITSGIFIAAFYLLGTIGILISLPMDDIGLISGIMDTFTKLFGDSAMGPAIVMILGIMALYTFVANMVTWTMGANRSAAQAANEGHLDPIFAKLSASHKTPANAAIVTGLVTTVVIIVYGLMAADAEDLFWTLFAFSSVVFLICYLFMFAAFLRLRAIDGDRPRAYRVPGGAAGAWILTLLCIAFIVQAIVFFIYTPGEFDIKYAGTIIAGVIVAVIVGELLISRAKPPA